MLKRASHFLLATALVGGAYFATFVYQPAPPAEEGGGSSVRAAQGTGGEGGRAHAVVVTTQSVDVTPYQDVFQSIGTVRANSRVLVQNEVAGKVLSSELAANAEVAAGDTLVRLEDRAATLALRTANAELAEAEDALKRLETLESQGSSAVTSVQISEARTAVEIARANVETAEYELEQRNITAPIAGRLGLSDIETGAYLGVGAEIVTITNLDSLRVDFTLPDRALDFLTPGLLLDVRLPTRPGSVYQAEITGVDTEIDSETRQIAVEARIDSDAVPVLPGSVVTIVASRPSMPAPSVPSLAITWSRDGAGVWTVTNDKVSRVPVDILHRSGDTVWLDADLDASMRVVVEGTQKLREGVTIATPDSAVAPTASRSREVAELDDGE